jgi:hypothetical protein
MPFKYLTRADIAVIVFFLVLSIAGLAGVRNMGFGGRHVIVEAGGVRTLVLPLGENTRTAAAGPLGETEIIVENGAVRIGSSPCPHHYCQHMGSINRRGEILVCVPNRIVVSITGGSEQDSLDGVTQ